MIMNKPLCHNYDKCENDALTLVSGMWLCGDCVIELNNKLKKLKERLLLEG